MGLIGEPMNCPTDHKAYATRVLVAQRLVELIADAKRTGRGGKSYRRLNVFACGNHFHVGRARTNPKGIVNKVKPEKLPTFAQAIRALKRLDEAYERWTDHYHKRKAELFGKMIEADRLRGDID
jgi:hypothetical protein